MKITVKTVNKGANGPTQFDVDIEDSETILQVKQKIQTAKPEFEAESCKLICAGRILQNDKSVADSSLKEGDFLVIIPGKKAAAPAPAPVPVAAPAEPAAPAAPAAGGAVVPPEPVAAATATDGAGSEAAIQQLTDMGFPREQAIAALRAAYGNPDRAVEYLFNGIPEEQPAAAMPPAGAMPPAAGGAVAPAAPAAPAVPASNTNAAGFQGAAFPQMPGAGGAAPPAAGGAADPMAAMGGANPMANPQMAQMLQMMQQNPQMMQQVLGELAQNNPELMAQIQQNPQAVMQMLAGMQGGAGAEGGMPPMGGAPGGAPPGQIQIQLNEEERAAVTRLEALGFPRAAVIQAYMACEKNEELAANFLFDMGEDF